MSNAVDILLIGGPKDGTMVCQPRPVPAYVEYNGVPIGTVTYHTTYIEIDNKLYRIALFDLSTDPAVITTAIAAVNHQPAWDLN